MNAVELVGLRNDHNNDRGDPQKYMQYIALPQISNTLAGSVAIACLLSVLLHSTSIARTFTVIFAQGSLLFEGSLIHLHFR